MIYSGFFRRAVAFILDMMIVSLPTAFIFMPVLGVQLMGVSSPEEMSSVQLGLLGLTFLSWQLISLLITWLYFALLESGTKQSTWGKRLLGIKVIGKEGNRISFARATGRFFAKFISYIVVYIGFIMAGFTNQKRALHDMIAETYVVKKEYEPGQELPDTKTHKLLLVIVSIIWLACVFGMSALSSVADMTPTQRVAQQAALRLVNLAKQANRLDQPVRLEGSTFYQTADGYRAVVVDPVSSHKFTLFLQNGAGQVCCQAFPLGNCADTGFESCN